MKVYDLRGNILSFIHSFIQFGSVKWKFKSWTHNLLCAWWSMQVLTTYVNNKEMNSQAPQMRPSFSMVLTAFSMASISVSSSQGLTSNWNQGKLNYSTCCSLVTIYNFTHYQCLRSTPRSVFSSGELTRGFVRYLNG